MRRHLLKLREAVDEAMDLVALSRDANQLANFGRALHDEVSKHPMYATAYFLPDRSSDTKAELKLAQGQQLDVDRRTNCLPSALRMT